MKSKFKNIINNIIFGFIFRVLSVIMPFIVRTFVIKYLGIEYVGINSLFASIFSFINLSELGIGTALTFVLYKPIEEKNNGEINAIVKLFKKWYNVVGLVVSSMTLIVFCFSDRLVPNDFPASLNFRLLFVLFSIGMILPYFIEPYSIVILSVNHREDIINIIASAFILLSSALQIISVLVLSNYYYFIVSISCISIAQAFTTYIVYKKLYRFKCEGELAIEKKNYIWVRIKALFTHKIGNTILFSADNIVISQIFGQVMLGVYGNYYLIIMTLSGLIDMVFNSFRAYVAKLFVTDNVNRTYDLFKKIYFWDINILGIVSSILLCSFQRFICLWVGEEQLLQEHTMYLIVLLFYVLRMGDAVGLYRTSLGLWDKDKYRPLISSACNLVINVVLSLLIGIDGVVISSIVCLIVFYFLNTARILYRYYFKKNSWRYYKIHFKHDLFNLIAACISYEICSLCISSSGLLGVVFSIVISGFVSTCIILLLNWKNDIFRELFHKIKNYHYRRKK